MASLLLSQTPVACCCLRENAAWRSRIHSSALFLGHESGGAISINLSSTKFRRNRMRTLPVVSAKEGEGGEGEKEKKKKIPSAVKRAKQAEKRRLRNRARKTAIRTRMKRALKALEALAAKGGEAQPDELTPIETMIGRAYSAIDKAVKVGTLHRNTGGRRKARLARAKHRVEIALGWYTPGAPPPSAATEIAAPVAV